MSQDGPNQMDRWRTNRRKARITHITIGGIILTVLTVLIIAAIHYK